MELFFLRSFFGFKDFMVNVVLMFIFWFFINLLSCCNVIFEVDESGRLVDDEVFVVDCFLYGLKLILFELVLMSEVYWFMKI